MQLIVAAHKALEAAKAPADIAAAKAAYRAACNAAARPRK